MKIDMHCHLWGERVPSPLWKKTLVDTGVRMSGKDRESVEEKIEEGLLDTTGDLLVEDMDRAGIDKSVILMLDFGLVSPEGHELPLDEQHQIFADAVERHSDRLIAFGGIDPRRDQAASFVERAVDEWDMKGIKLHPAAGFYPNENFVYPIYEKCQQLDIPVVVHTGPEASPFYSKYGQPVYMDEIANRFPDLDIVLAHAGLSRWEEAAEIAALKQNVYVDLAYWQTKSLRRPKNYVFEQLRWLIDSVGKGNVLLGTDWPALRLVDKVDHPTWIQTLEDLPSKSKDEIGVEFSEDEIEAMMGDNAEALLFS